MEVEKVIIPSKDTFWIHKPPAKLAVQRPKSPHKCPPSMQIPPYPLVRRRKWPLVHGLYNTVRRTPCLLPQTISSFQFFLHFCPPLYTYFRQASHPRKNVVSETNRRPHLRRQCRYRPCRRNFTRQEPRSPRHHRVQKCQRRRRGRGCPGEGWACGVLGPARRDV